MGRDARICVEVMFRLPWRLAKMNIPHGNFAHTAAMPRLQCVVDLANIRAPISPLEQPTFLNRLRILLLYCRWLNYYSPNIRRVMCPATVMAHNQRTVSIIRY